MQLYKTLSFLMQAITIGLAIAFVVVLMKPEWIHNDQGRAVEIHEISRPAPAPQTPVMTSGPVSYADAVAIAAPGVVNIHTAKLVTTRSHPLLDDPFFRHFFGNQFGTPRQQVQTSLGSGVIFSGQGLVLTNHHVVSGADEIQIMLRDGRSAQAQVVGVDPDTDLAVLRVDLENLPAMTIGASEQMRIGDVVLAIGNPFGVGQTVTLGIISATGRNQLGINTYEDFIQTDAAINPGNSGGALVNAHGELVGINTAIYSRTGGSQGIGFAIPVELAKDVLQQIVEKGRVVRGWLGIEAQDLTPALAESFRLESLRGTVVAGILRGGPADLAGLRPGDVITRLSDRDIANAREAMNRIARQAPGSRLRIEGIREGKPFTLEAEVGERPPAQQRQP
ncbi:MAG: Do family serine endopeptidase [Gammaproteobacteria bacterium]